MKVSIIIPVYNVEAYLFRCLHSILNQSLKDIEVILIDDGSTDNSGKICDKFAKQDTRIRVVHQTNSGVSLARNRGIDMAQGEYIGFVDPDDYIDECMYETLVQEIESNEADVAICSFSYVKSDKIIHNDNSQQIEVISKDEAIQRYFKEKRPFDYSFLCNKLFNRYLFENIRLNATLSIQEDSEVFIRILSKVNTCVYISRPLYSYYLREDSLTQHKFNKKNIKVLDSLYEIYKYTCSNIKEFKSDALNKYLLYFFNIITEIVGHGNEFEKEYQTLRKSLYKDYIVIIKNKNILLKYKAHVTFLILLPRWYKKYLKSRL